MIRLSSLFFVVFIAFSHASDIFEAIENNSIIDTKSAIQSGVDINMENKDGITPLMFAIYKDNVEIVELLLDSGSDANLISSGELPLFLAVAKGNVAVVRLLLDNGVIWKGIKDSDDKTPLMIASLFDSSDMFQYVLNNLNEDINAQDKAGRTALMHAIDAQKSKYVSLLIDSGADVNAVDFDGNTALMFAATDTPNSDTIVKMLLEAGADKIIENNNSMSALDFAKQNNASKIIALLAEDTPLRDSAIDINDLPTFYNVIRNGDYETFSKYIELGVDINGRANGNDTPLIVAAANGQPQMVKDLIALGADIEAQNDISATPLVLATFHGYKEIVAFLLDSGANVNAVGKDDNWSALMSAASNGDIEIAKILLDAGAKKDIKNNDGNTALDIAKSEGNDEMVAFLSDNATFANAVINGDINVVNQFLDDGLDVDTLVYYDGANSTPLLIASQLGHRELAELLIQRDADLDFRNDSGDTPLVMAVYKDQKWTAKALIEAGAKIDIRDTASSATPLMIASYQNYYDIAEMLLDSGASVNAVDEDGWSSLMSAALAQNAEIVSLLLDSGADVNLINSDGKSALDLAADPEVYDMIENAGGKVGGEIDGSISANANNIFDAIKMGDLRLVGDLLVSGVDINMQDDRGYTPLLLALKEGEIDIAKFLIKKGADLEIQNENSSTPLAIASFRGYINIVILLLDSGANVNAVGKDDNWSALMSAASGDNLDIVSLLIESGADINIINSAGESALDIARKDNSNKVAKYLELKLGLKK